MCHVITLITRSVTCNEVYFVDLELLTQISYFNSKTTSALVYQGINGKVQLLKVHGLTLNTTFIVLKLCPGNEELII